MSEAIPAKVYRCTTHHAACDCREWKFEQLEAENAKLASERASDAIEFTKLNYAIVNLESERGKLQAENEKLRESLPLIDNRTHDRARELLGKPFQHMTDEIIFPALPYHETKEIVVDLLASNEQLRAEIAKLKGGEA